MSGSLTPPELAKILGLTVEELLRLSHAAHRLYRCRHEPKRSGGFRLIEAPYPHLKSKQRILSDAVLNKLPVSDCLFGATGKSQIDAARIHRRQPILITLDLQNFFPSVTVRHIQFALASHGFLPETADIICRLCTRKRRLPQGAPTSPTLARLVVSPVIGRIESAIRSVSSRGLVTQYVDDLAVSGPGGIKRMLPLVRRIFRQAGFTIHPAKTKLMRESETQEMLGIRVNRHLDVSDSFKEKLARAKRELPASSPQLAGMQSWRRQVRASNSAPT